MAILSFGLLAAPLFSTLLLSNPVAGLPQSAPLVARDGAFTRQGCFSETPQRLFTAGFKGDDQMTIQMCAAFCSKKPYFGLEYGRECFCGDQAALVSRLVSDSDCSFPCAGNSIQKCGAGMRLEVYSNDAYVPYSPPVIDGAPYLGCFVDGNPRVLPERLISTSDMTIAKCSTHCAGYKYFGIEYGRECFCGDSAPTVPAPESECSMPCSGDPDSFCGSGMRLSVFGPVTIPAPATTNPQTVGNFTYEGCYTDSPGLRVLSGPSTGGSSTTLQSCATFCASYTYFGTENGNECFCGNALHESSAKKSETNCQKTCAGDPSLICGDANRLSLYKKTAPPQSSSTSTRPNSTTKTKYSTSSTVTVMTTTISATTNGTTSWHSTSTSSDTPEPPVSTIETTAYSSSTEITDSTPYPTSEITATWTSTSIRSKSTSTLRTTTYWHSTFTSSITSDPPESTSETATDFSTTGSTESTLSPTSDTTPISSATRTSTRSKSTSSFKTTTWYLTYTSSATPSETSTDWPTAESTPYPTSESKTETTSDWSTTESTPYSTTGTTFTTESPSSWTLSTETSTATSEDPTSYWTSSTSTRYSSTRTTPTRYSTRTSTNPHPESTTEWQTTSYTTSIEPMETTDTPSTEPSDVKSHESTSSTSTRYSTKYTTVKPPPYTTSEWQTTPYTTYSTSIESTETASTAQTEPSYVTSNEPTSSSTPYTTKYSTVKPPLYTTTEWPTTPYTTYTISIEPTETTDTSVGPSIVTSHESSSSSTLFTTKYSTVKPPPHTTTEWPTTPYTTYTTSVWPTETTDTFSTVQIEPSSATSYEPTFSSSTKKPPPHSSSLTTFHTVYTTSSTQSPEETPVTTTSSSAVSTPTAPAGNLITENPGFESGAWGWTFSGESDYVNDPAHSGYVSLVKRFSNTVGSSFDFKQFIDVEAGASYTASFWWSHTNPGADCRVFLMVDFFPNFNVVDTRTVAAGGWSQLTVDFQATGTNTKVKGYAHCEPLGAEGESYSNTIYFDDVSLVKTS